MRIKVTDENGQELMVSISDEDYASLFSKNANKTGYEKVETGHPYFKVISDGGIHTATELNNINSKVAYENANYYSDFRVADNNSRADKLMRHLRRFAVEHRKKALDWIDTRNTPWVFVIQGDPETKRLSVHKIPCGLKQFGTIYFDTEENAKLAIDTYRDELTWFFCEYKDSL